MAHGNASDMVFFAIVAIVVQWFAYPATLFEDIGPLKAQFTAQTTDMNIAIKFGGGLLLAHGLTLSGVSWNPKNGKMAGFGGFIVAGHTAFSTFKADSDVFIPRLFYVYAAVIFLGALHVFLFPSNPLPPKTPESKNNHGNASDFAFFALLGASMGCIFYPEHLFKDIGPLKAQFSKESADLAAMIKFIGSMMLMMGLTLSGVKWNPINGKMAGIGGLICSGYTAYSVFKADNDVFVPRMFYLYAAIIFFGALHIFAFPSNPLIAKADKKD